MTTKVPRKDIRVRNWRILVYPESAPVNWKEILNDLMIPWACSPLHDKDTDDNGELKKPHYHCLLAFTNKKSYQQVLSITKKLSSPNPKQCENVKGLIRYFAHLDQSDKYRYDENQIIGYSGFDTDYYLQMTVTERNNALKDIRQHIRENHITELKSLYAYTDEHRPDWSIVINNHTYPINTFLASLRHS
ncbi:replication protein [Vagococcus carniphilus]|uniref:replication protein n=1 Tax=Vagococcus carniphilus TaxID=218144 RepID=UPI0028916D32|nr:replication protein [Vagococcus carniphilus]MDT2832275.1 replication protein [Vagococcus carniphilus]MDT2841027.1 replication protein [Vagococcus carniphilus]MDT2855762.1 replication protein [Vagococcus carniphilus]